MALYNPKIELQLSKLEIAELENYCLSAKLDTRAIASGKKRESTIKFHKNLKNLLSRILL